MHLTCLAERLGRFCDLTPDEVAAIEGLWTGTRAVRRGYAVRAERSRADEMLVVAEGWLFSAMLLEDGRRQIIRFHVPGDLIGGDVLGLAEAPDAITALTDAEVHLIDCAGLGRLFLDQPRLAALLYTGLQMDQVALADRLISLGRSTAKARVAALLLWVAERLSATRIGAHFLLPMTQEEIGDATGLTAVHVNRTLRVLEEEKLIGRNRSMIRMVDPDGLARVAAQPIRREQLRAGWLPQRG